MIKYLLNIIKGIFIGIGVVVPGVSGSVIAILFGVYDQTIYILNNPSENIKKNILFLTSLLIGIVLGTNLFGNVLMYLLKTNETLICYIFAVLILTGVPMLKNEIDKKNNGSFNIKIFLITLTISFILFILNKINYSNVTIYSGNFKVFILLIIGGFLFIAGKIIPGVSSSFFMMIIGIYDLVLNLMANPFSFSIYNYIELIPFFIGVLLGLFIITKILNSLLQNYYSETYSGIIGFVVGSIFAIIPELNIYYIVISIITLLVFNKIYKIVK